MINSEDKSLKPWALDHDKLVEKLDASIKDGLNNTEVKQRQKKYGKNILRRAKKRSVLEIFVSQFKSLLIGLLIVATIISILFGDLTQGIAIATVLGINTILGFFTELKAVRSVEALRDIGQVKTTVYREGKQKDVPADKLVPGDIILLKAGDVVTADVRLVEASKLRVDESILTGESVPVEKSFQSLDEDTPLAEQSNMLFKGTSITRGTGKGITVNIGMKTQIGKIGTLVEDVSDQETPLERRLQSFGQKMFIAILAIAVAVTILGILSGKDVFVMIETGIALSIATVPEGLPVVATIALARGVWQMAKRNAVVNRLSSVQTLGTTTVIDTDKTGTLTENQMTVVNIILDSKNVKVTGEGLAAEGDFVIDDKVIDLNNNENLKELIINGILCNNASINDQTKNKIEATGEPMEIGLLVVGLKAGFDRKKILKELPQEAKKAFDPEVKMMATIHKEDGKYRFAVKGAPESVLESCKNILTNDGQKPFSDERKDEWQQKIKELAESGLRLLAVANKISDSKDEEAFENLSFLGLVGFLDPAREDVPNAIKLCKKAGINVVMITGDHPETAKNIAFEVGIVDDQKTANVIVGKELKDIDNLTEKDKERLLDTHIFARVNPEQKLQLVNIQQQKGSVVAMTGDGVNDAPALKKADIGIAMGQRGTQVAREASDMVLKDDNFSSIVSAIHSGRVIFDNIRNFVFYLLSCNISEVIIISVASVLGLPLPLLPLHILYLNMITDVFPALALGVGEGDSNIMDRSPRNKKEGILKRSHWRDMLIYGGIMASEVMAIFLLGLYYFHFNYEKVVTMSFLTLAFTQLVHVFNVRNKESSLIYNNVSTNKYVWLAIALCVGLLLITIFIVPLANLLKLVELDFFSWILVAAFSMIVFVIGQIRIEIQKN